MKKWRILNNLASKHGSWSLNDLIYCLLENRGFKTAEEIRAFLKPSLSDVTAEKVGIDRKELDKAIDRIKKAIKAKESIVVYSDYDVDGVCGSAILWETLYNLGAKVMPYIPHRVKEGYGLSRQGIDKLREKYNVQLIITVDHGISAHSQVKYARSHKIDVIITDHHLKPAKLPLASAIVHTTQLCGSGVAWILTEEIGKKIKNIKPDIADHLDLVAIATIADLMPLVGPNRTLAKFGLEKLNKTERLGLLALIEKTGLKEKTIGAWEVGHILAPQINAMGRLAHALEALRLLCTRRLTRAKRLAFKLAATNRQRQLLTEEGILLAKSLIDEEIRKLIFISHHSYQEGIIGLIAGKLAEKYNRPAIVVAEGKKYSKASARSIKGFNIVEAIRQAGDLLVNCGGHPMAAGFTVETKNLAILREKLHQVVERQLSDELLSKILTIDCQIDLKNIDWQLVEELERFKPFGTGNPQPVFASRQVIVEDAWLVGAEKQHLKLRLADFPEFDVIGFNKGHFFEKVTRKRVVDIAYSLEINNWNNNSCLQLKLKDIKIP